MINGINEHIVTHNQTVLEWLSKWDAISDFTSNKFVDLKIAGDVTNYSRIIANYNKEELEHLNTSATDSLIIKSGTSIGLPNFAIRRQLARPKVVPDISRQTDFVPFISEQLKALFNDPKYYSDIRDNTGQLNGRTDVNDISVYIWIRSISQPDEAFNYQGGAWFNVSAFVESVTTTVTKGVGSFNISFAPVVAKYNFESGWHLSSRGYGSGSVRDEVYSTANISKYRGKYDNYLSREDFFFSRVLQENDLVYIRFEKLAMEQEKELIGRTFGGNDVPGKIYDMIGLVDQVLESSNESSVRTQVQGRDLMKCLIEDGSYFFPEQFAQNIFTNENSILSKRNRIELEAKSLLSIGYSFKTIATVLKFIFNKFSNIGIIPSRVFSDYGDRSNKNKYQLQTSSLVSTGAGQVIDEINAKFLKEDREGVWRIIELILDPKAALRVMSDNSISADNGSIINSIRKLCQDPFVEFSGDTYGDKYYFTVRKPPFDEKGYKGMVYGNVVSEGVHDGVNTINVSIGGKLTTRAISPINTKSPRELNGRPGDLSDLVIDIDDSIVESESLIYSDEVYSWYRLIPRGLGVQDDSSLFLLAAVVPLDEYAKVWGNKALNIEYNYSPAEFVDDSFLQKEMKYAESQTYLDLQYLIQSHAYLPFTRHGTIKIKGDRRIKRGVFVYYKPTDEVFYVDAVTNTRTLNDRTTTLQVSRGMRKKYIRGVDVAFGPKIQRVSYFNIVNTTVPNDASINKNDFLKNWKENVDVFNFFMQRRQWVDEGNVG